MFFGVILKNFVIGCCCLSLLILCDSLHVISAALSSLIRFFFSELFNDDNAVLCELYCAFACKISSPCLLYQQRSRLNSASVDVNVVILFLPLALALADLTFILFL